MTQKTEDKDRLIKRGRYYRPNNQGYTDKRSRAGRFTKAEAVEAVAMNDGTVKMIEEGVAGRYAPAVPQRNVIAYQNDRIKELEEALKPFADLCQFGDPFTVKEDRPAYGLYGKVLTINDLRRAKRLISEG